MICCEGNAAFYEAGMIEIPLNGMLCVMNVLSCKDVVHSKLHALCGLMSVQHPVVYVQVHKLLQYMYVMCMCFHISWLLCYWLEPSWIWRVNSELPLH